MTMEGQLADDLELGNLINNAFPRVVHAFGYGSGVFVQQNENEAEKMIDLILAVDDAREFHEENLKRHRHHYSLPCRLGGPLFCARLQNDFGAKVFFHAFVRLEGKLIKYGVVEKRCLLDDLNNWSYLYTSGRLHKPTLPLISDNEVVDAQRYRNLPFALATSLLLLEQVNENAATKNVASMSTVFQSIAQISYSGDPRMDIGGEDPNKVQKLVHGNAGQMERFRRLYQPSLDDFSDRGFLSYCSSTEQVQWDPSLLRHALPPRLALNHSLLQPAIRSIVHKASRTQSLKGIVTAGIVKSAQYAMAKLSKGLLRV